MKPITITIKADIAGAPIEVYSTSEMALNLTTRRGLEILKNNAHKICIAAICCSGGKAILTVPVPCVTSLSSAETCLCERQAFMLSVALLSFRYQCSISKLVADHMQSQALGSIGCSVTAVTTAEPSLSIERMACDEPQF